MNGNKAVIDSNIIIFASQEKVNFSNVIKDYEEIFVSIETFIEVYGYNFGTIEEKKAIDKIFENLEIIDVSKEIANIVLGYTKNKSKKIKLPDAIILATANYLTADLLTDDWGDFEGFDRTMPIVKIKN